MTTNSQPTDYKTWTREQLIERLVALEGPKPVASSLVSSQTEPATATATAANVVDDVDALKSSSSSPTTTTTRPTKAPKSFDFSKHPKRKIALKFCYSGWEYGGLAYQSNVAQLPAVENVLFEAMAKARLVDPSGGLDGCGWEKCGRTDKGVSSAGQVISLWIRSAIGNVGGGEEQENKKEGDAVENVDGGEEEAELLQENISKSSSPSPLTSTGKQQSETKNELDYVGNLNRILPPTIRILAWAPVAPAFSARFSCKYRHYKYFFSSHSLDISAMCEAVAKLIGEHDFRNLCKVDAQKQITVFRRTIWHADIELVDPSMGEERGEKMYVFNLIGNAFLYHQVRHIMSILLLIGTGLEKPSLVTKLMNVASGAESAAEGEELEVVESKPEYQMADALPLMLWDCGYAEEDVQWRSGTLVDESTSQTNEDTRRAGHGTETDLYHQLHSIWNRSRVYTILDRHFLQAAEQYHQPPRSVLPLSPSSITTTNLNDSNTIAQDFGVPVDYPLGGGAYKRAINYVPVLKRNRLATVDVINERWRAGKGSRRAERRGENSNGNGNGRGFDDGNE